MMFKRTNRLLVYRSIVSAEHNTAATFADPINHQASDQASVPAAAGCALLVVPICLPVWAGERRGEGIAAVPGLAATIRPTWRCTETIQIDRAEFAGKKLTAERGTVGDQMRVRQTAELWCILIDVFLPAFISSSSPASAAIYCRYQLLSYGTGVTHISLPLTRLVAWFLKLNLMRPEFSNLWPDNTLFAIDSLYRLQPCFACW